jgi:hypothetical protein
MKAKPSSEKDLLYMRHHVQAQLDDGSRTRQFPQGLKINTFVLLIPSNGE